MKNNREFVMLSHSLKLSEAGTFSLGNWFVSEKLDGMRAIWLPDTRGHQVSRLPFANLDKDRTGTANRIATGLWSRYAKPIWVPDWFVESLPKDQFLDGELWTGRDEFQKLVSIVKTGVPGPEWRSVQYRIFDAPSPDAIYRNGKIHNGQLKKHFLGVFDWCKANIAFDYQIHADTFDRVWYQRLRTIGDRWAIDGVKHLFIHPQQQLTWRHVDAVKSLEKLLEETLAVGGEGLIVRAPHSLWEPIRSKVSLKIKPDNEAEGRVVGYNPGQGRLEGMIGSLQIEGELTDATGRTYPVRFDLSGLSDADRTVPSTKFPVGTVVTYLYRATTEDGLPREARFLRVRSDL